MLDAPVYAFSQRMVRPLRDPQNAPVQPVNLAAGTYKGGTILGQLTAAANDVQTETVTATGGTIKLTLEFPVGNKQTTAAIAYNANAATRQAAVVALSNVGSGNVAVTGTGPYVYTFGGNLASRPIPVMTADNTAATGGTSSVAHTTTGATGGEFKAYASGNSDGSQTAKVILAIDCVVDASGYVSFSDAGNGGFWGERQLTAPAYYGGTFNTADLTGLDANAVTNLAGRLVEGTVSAGILVF